MGGVGSAASWTVGNSSGISNWATNATFSNIRVHNDNYAWIDNNLTDFFTYLDFNDGSGSSKAYDLNLTQANNGTLTNMNTTGNATSGWTSSGKFGNALQFDGVNDYVRITHNTALNLNLTYTYSIWFKYGEQSASANDELFSNGYNGGNKQGVLLKLQSNGLVFFGQGNQGTVNLGAISSINNSIWHQAALTYNGTTIFGYLDGVYITQTTLTTPFNYSTDDVFIGAENGAATWLNGSLDEFKIYARNLSATEIAIDYNQTFLSEGNITSIKKDAESVGTIGDIWSNISFQGSIPTNTNISIWINSSNDNVTWSGWSLIQSNATINTIYNLLSGRKGRYTSWKLQITGNNSISPYIYNVTMTSSSCPNCNNVAIPIPIQDTAFRTTYHMYNVLDWTNAPRLYIYNTNILSSIDRGGLTYDYSIKPIVGSIFQEVLNSNRMYFEQYNGVDVGVNSPTRASNAYAYNSMLMSDVSYSGDLNQSSLKMLDPNGKGVVTGIVVQNKNNGARTFAIQIYGNPIYLNGSVLNSLLQNANNTPSDDRILIGNATKWVAIGFNESMKAWQINDSLITGASCSSSSCFKKLSLGQADNIIYNTTKMSFIVISNNFTLSGYAKKELIFIIAIGDNATDANNNFDMLKNNWNINVLKNITTLINSTYQGTTVITEGLNADGITNYLTRYWDYALSNIRGFERPDYKYDAGKTYTDWGRDSTIASMGTIYTNQNYAKETLKLRYNSTTNPKGVLIGETSGGGGIDDSEFWWIIASVKAVKITGDESFMSYIYDNITDFLDTYITNPSYFNQTNYYLNTTVACFDPNQPDKYPEWGTATNSYVVLNQILVYKGLREAAWLARQKGNATKANLYDGYADALNNTFMKDFLNTTNNDLFNSINITDYSKHNRYSVHSVMVSTTDLMTDTQKANLLIRINTAYRTATDGSPLSTIPPTDSLYGNSATSWYGGWWEVLDPFYTKLLKQQNGNSTNYMVNISLWLNGTVINQKNANYFPEYTYGGGTNGFAYPQLWSATAYIQSIIEDVIGIEINSNFNNTLNFTIKPNTNQINLTNLTLGNKLMSIRFSGNDVNISSNTTFDWWNYQSKALIKNSNEIIINYSTTQTTGVTTTYISTFNLTSSSVSLYDTSGQCIDCNGNWAQITSTSATSITFNSSQNYTGTNWQISVSGDLTGKTWKYKAHNDNTWLTVPSANITYNGTHTLFNLVNINVSEAANSNELLAATCMTIRTSIATYPSSIVSNTFGNIYSGLERDTATIYEVLFLIVVISLLAVTIAYLTKSNNTDNRSSGI